MRKTYYKLKDIDTDIKTYQSLLRRTSAGTQDYKDILAELHWLEENKKTLLKKNKCNRAFTHDNIPRCPTRKTKPKSAKQCPKLKTFLEKEIKEAEAKLITLKKQLDSL